MSSHSATVRVSLSIDVLVTDRWGGECTVQQIYEQAASSALGRIRKIAIEAGINISEEDKPRITAVLVNRA